MNLRNRLRDKQDEPHTSALNDILFILLFFFLIISTLANPNVIPLSSPRAKSDGKAKQNIMISVDSKGGFYSGTSPISEAVLDSVMAAGVRKDPDNTDPTVVINADSTASTGSVVAVMRAARRQHLKTVLSVDAR